MTDGENCAGGKNEDRGDERKTGECFDGNMETEKGKIETHFIEW